MKLTETLEAWLILIIGLTGIITITILIIKGLVLLLQLI